MNATLPVVVLILTPFVLVLTALNLLTTSDMLGYGSMAYSFLDHPHELVEGRTVRTVSIELGAVLVAIFYLLDMLRWPKVLLCVTVPFCAFTCALFFIGIVFQTPSEPTIPLALWPLLTVLLVRVLHRTIFHGTPGNVYSLGITTTFLGVATLVGGMWVWWVWFKLEKLDFSLKMQEATPFVLWCSPAVCSLVYMIIGSWGWIRARYYQLVVIPGENDDPDDDHDGFVIAEMKFAVVLLVLTVLVAWIAASIAVTSIALSKMILQLSAVMFVAIAVYIVDFIGVERIIEVTKDSDVVETAMWFLFGEWSKGAITLLCWPLLPVYFAVEFVHQRARSTMRMLGLVPESKSGDGCLCVTKEASRLWEHMMQWELSSVLVKSIYVGIAIFAVQVGVSQGLVVFLAWLNEYLEAWTLTGALGLLFVVEIGLFLFPPVSGIPLYMVAGIVVIPKWTQTLHQGFYAGISAATVFCFVLKMVAIGLEQKAIGQPCSRSVGVKKYIGVHTPAMKALRCLLEEPGFGAGKVAVLVGGPDWPTSVITGILRLPLCSMLVGSIPVIVLIFPCVFGAGFLLRAGQEPANAAQYASIANVGITLSAVLQGGVTMLATYYLQAVMNEHVSDAGSGGDWMKDPQEDEILEAIKVDNFQAEQVARRTCWAVQPFWVRATLLKGSFFASASVCVMINPVADPFTKFEITDSVSDLPGGSAISLVQPTGWLMLALVGVSCICLMVFQAWVSCRMRDARSEEEPLLSSS